MSNQLELLKTERHDPCVQQFIQFESNSSQHTHCIRFENLITSAFERNHAKNVHSITATLRESLGNCMNFNTIAKNIIIAYFCCVEEQ